MISVDRIIYNKFNSRDFNVKVCFSFNGDNGEVDTYLNREAVASENYRGDFKRVHNYKYNDVLAPVITFIKEDFEDFTMAEHRRILKWLTSKDTASFLTVYHDDSENISYEILGAFTEIQSYKLGNGRIVGIQATFESVTPWAFSPLKTVTQSVVLPSDAKDIDSSYKVITINVATDDPQTPIYPRITINQSSTGHVVTIDREPYSSERVKGTVYKDIVNNIYYWLDENGVWKNSPTNTSGITSTTGVSLVNRYKYGTGEGEYHTFKTTVANNVTEEVITIDGANRVISTSRSGNRIFDNDFNWNWIPLYEGRNLLTVVGRCKVTVEWREPIKCGDF